MNRTSTEQAQNRHRRGTEKNLNKIKDISIFIILKLNIIFN